MTTMVTENGHLPYKIELFMLNIFPGGRGTGHKCSFLLRHIYLIHISFLLLEGMFYIAVLKTCLLTKY